jgi:hypothetical protein
MQQVTKSLVSSNVSSAKRLVLRGCIKKYLSYLKLNYKGKLKLPKKHPNLVSVTWSKEFEIKEIV